MPRRIWIAALVMAIHLATSPRPAGGVGVRGLGRHRMGVSEQAGVLQRRDRSAVQHGGVPRSRRGTAPKLTVHTGASKASSSAS